MSRPRAATDRVKLVHRPLPKGPGHDLRNCLFQLMPLGDAAQAVPATRLMNSGSNVAPKYVQGSPVGLRSRVRLKTAHCSATPIDAPALAGDSSASGRSGALLFARVVLPRVREALARTLAAPNCPKKACQVMAASDVVSTIPDASLLSVRRQVVFQRLPRSQDAASCRNRQYSPRTSGTGSSARAHCGHGRYRG